MAIPHSFGPLLVCLIQLWNAGPHFFTHDAARVNELPDLIHLGHVLPCCGLDLLGHTQPLTLPCEAAAHGPAEDAGQFPAEFLLQSTVPLLLWNSNVKVHNAKTPPDGVVAAIDGELVVRNDDDFELRHVLKILLVQTTHLQPITASRLFHECLCQPPPLLRL